MGLRNLRSVVEKPLADYSQNVHLSPDSWSASLLRWLTYTNHLSLKYLWSLITDLQKKFGRAFKSNRHSNAKYLALYAQWLAILHYGRKKTYPNSPNNFRELRYSQWNTWLKAMVLNWVLLNSTNKPTKKNSAAITMGPSGSKSLSSHLLLHCESHPHGR